MLSPTGLRHRDAKLLIYIKKNDGMILHYHDGASVEIKAETDHAEFTPELESLLKRLLAHPID